MTKPLEAVKSTCCNDGSSTFATPALPNTGLALRAPHARAACDKYSTPDKPRFAAGAIGPTPKTASISPDVNDPGARNVDFDTLRQAYYEQAKALMEGGCDVFLIETIFDTLNAKAAIFAVDQLFEDTGERLPIIISGTVTDASGRILSGQTVSAFWHSVRHARPIAIGLNCALGAALMRPYIEELAKVDPSVSVCADVQNTLVNNMFKFYANDDVKSRFLPRLAKDTVGCFCLSESGSGSDAFALATRAEDLGPQGFRVNGASGAWCEIWLAKTLPLGAKPDDAAISFAIAFVSASLRSR